MTTREKYAGAMIGLAVGDALGTTVEFATPGTFPPVTDMVGGGWFELKAGEWTDDTSLALCLAESLIEMGGFDPVDQLRRYVRWRDHGHLSSKGECFDIGGTTNTALNEFVRTGNAYSGPDDEYSSGNGSLMRLAPIPLVYARFPALAIHLAGESSRTTHGARNCIDACRYMAGLIVGALSGDSKEEILSPFYSPVKGLWEEKPLSSRVGVVANGSFKQKGRRIQGSGYVVSSLEAALWAFHTTSTFEEGVLAAVNLGDDADTTGAVFGQLAGAFYGVEAIPSAWRNRVAKKELIEEYSHRMFALGMKIEG